MRKRESPQQLRAQRTRGRLLAAARRAFAEAGYTGTTVDDVAQAAGCSKGAYYFHFAAKEDALLALLDDWTRDRTRRLEQAADGDRPPEAALNALLETLLSLEATDRWEQRLLLEFWSQGERNPKVGRRLARAHRFWRRLLARAIGAAQEAGALPATVAADELAEVALALHDGLVVRRCLGAATGASARGRASAALALLAGSRTLRLTG